MTGKNGYSADLFLEGIVLEMQTEIIRAQKFGYSVNEAAKVVADAVGGTAIGVLISAKGKKSPTPDQTRQIYFRAIELIDKLPDKEPSGASDAKDGND